jgi:hypothetical protein
MFQGIALITGGFRQTQVRKTNDGNSNEDYRSLDDAFGFHKDFSRVKGALRDDWAGIRMPFV